MEKSRLALRKEKLAELKEIDNAKAVELAELAEQVKVIEDSKER